MTHDLEEGRKPVWTRAGFWVALAWVPALLCIPFFISMYITPSNAKYPRKIFNGMTLDALERKVKASENKAWAKEGATLALYVFKDSAGKTIQEIDGDRGWNVSLFCDFDKDGVPEFLVRHLDFKEMSGRLWVACYKYQKDKFVFSRRILREELKQSLYLDYKFFPMPYWMAIYKISLICFVFGVAVTVVFIIRRWMHCRRGRMASGGG